MTLLEGSPCWNGDCAAMAPRRRGALVREGNSDLRIALKMQSAEAWVQRKIQLTDEVVGFGSNFR